MSGNSTLTARYSRSRVLIGIAAMLFYAAISALAIIAVAAVGFRAIALLFLLFSTAIAIRGLLAFADRHIVLEIGPDGILDRRVHDGRIPWYAIADIQELRITFLTFYLLTLNEPKHNFIRSRIKLWRNAMVTFRFGGDTFVNVADLDVSSREFERSLAEHWRNWM